MTNGGSKEDVLFFHLQEASIHAKNLADEIASGQVTADDAVEILVDCAHIQRHLCLAWNKGVSSGCSPMTDDEAANSIPNWNLMFRLVDPKY